MKHLALMTGILMLAIVARGQFVPATPQARKSLDDCAVMIHMAERPGPGRSQGRDVLSCGTGILIEGGRYLATNSHVGGRETVQEGKFSPEDGKRYGLDFQTRAGAVEVSSAQRERRESDVAIYRVRSTPVEGIDRYVAFGDLKEGQPVWALSNAGCRPWTLSSGIIIALVDRRRNREVLDAMAKGLNEEGSFIRERYDKMIVATGSLGTFGSSGGPVVDQHGRLIGIMFAVSSQFVFVIPIETAFETLNLSAPSTTDIESNSSTLHGAVFTVRPPQGALTLKDYFVEPSEEFTQPENTSMPLIRYRDVAADEESYSALAGLLNETNAAGFRVIRLNSAIKQGSVSDISIIDETGEERDLALAWNPDQAAPGHAIALVLNRAVFLLLPKTEETVNTRIELTLHLQDGREIMALPERAASGEE